jgi:ABC-type phosphate transport system ATPase subunit
MDVGVRGRRNRNAFSRTACEMVCNQVDMVSCRAHEVEKSMGLQGVVCVSHDLSETHIWEHMGSRVSQDSMKLPGATQSITDVCLARAA